ncbi:MAG: ABC transporter transmembrane domain-containing protein [Solirubrobacteraceae bacterium]
MVGLTILGGGVSFFESYLSSWVGQRFVITLRGQRFSHVQGLSLATFQRRPVGDILTRLTGDISTIETLLISGSLDLVSAVGRLVFFAGALVLLDWRLAIVAMVAGPSLGLLIRFTSRRIQQVSRDVRRRTGGMIASAEQSLSSIALVQAYSRQQLESERYERENRGAFAATMTVTRLRGAFGPLTDVVQAVSALAVVPLAAQGARARHGGGNAQREAVCGGATRPRAARSAPAWPRDMRCCTRR